MDVWGFLQTSQHCTPEVCFRSESVIPSCLEHVRFSNRPVGVKRFRLSTTAAVDVTGGLALLYGMGTSALPSWDPRMGWSNLMGGLAGSGRQVQADMRTHLIHRPARDTIPPPGGARVSSYCDWS